MNTHQKILVAAFIPIELRNELMERMAKDGVVAQSDAVRRAIAVYLNLGGGPS